MTGVSQGRGGCWGHWGMRGLDGWRSAGRTEGTWGPRGRWRHLPWEGVGCWLMPWPSWSVSQSCMRMKGSRPFCVSLLHGLGRDSMSLTLPWDSPST